jgi:hypothetical protein
MEEYMGMCNDAGERRAKAGKIKQVIQHLEPDYGALQKHLMNKEWATDAYEKAYNSEIYGSEY